MGGLSFLEATCVNLEGRNFQEGKERKKKAGIRSLFADKKKRYLLMYKQ